MSSCSEIDFWIGHEISVALCKYNLDLQSWLSDLFLRRQKVTARVCKISMLISVFGKTLLPHWLLSTLKAEMLVLIQIPHKMSGFCRRLGRHTSMILMRLVCPNIRVKHTLKLQGPELKSWTEVMKYYLAFISSKVKINDISGRSVGMPMHGLGRNQWTGESMIDMLYNYKGWV